MSDDHQFRGTRYEREFLKHNKARMLQEIEDKFKLGEDGKYHRVLGHNNQRLRVI
jgi:hypothetical protein